jgi:hypothetical protein
MVRTHGGIARQGLTTLFNTKKESTTHVITNADALKNLGDKFVKRVSRHNMHIITEQWIVDTIEQGKVADEKLYPVPGVEETLEALKNEDSENEDSGDSDYIETHVRKRKKHSPVDRRPKRKRSTEHAFDFDEGINLLIETQQRESENEKVLGWSIEEVKEWFKKTLNIDEEDMATLMEALTTHKIDGEALLEMDAPLEDLKQLGVNLGCCMKIRKAVKRFKLI